MDCDDVMLLLAGEQRTLTGVESSRLRVHLDDCDACRELAADRDDTEWRWLSRIPASDIDAALFDAVIVDPVVFGATTEIAEGGMGRVMRAFDRRLGREVAIKELLDPALRGRFDREARITARLQHPAVVPVYEAGTFGDGRSFYTMPLVPGKTLHDAIVEAGSLAQRLRLMPKVRAVADAIAYAHSRGVIHRDLKPSNVLVGEFGETIVIDWGLAKDRSGEPDDAYLTRRGGAPHLTLVGSVVGTPCYMSPAQASGEPADATDDVYALGAILYTVLTGVPPYLEGRDAVAVIAATIDGPPRPIVELAPDAPADLRAIVERAMARTVTDRFSSAKQFSDELARFEAGQLLLSRGYSTRELISRWVRRHRRALIIAALSMVAVVALGIVWSRYRSTAAALATQVRGGELAALYRDASRQAYQIDRDLLRMETALAGLATAAGDALVGPEPSGTPALYFVEDFASPSRRPPDFGRKTAYRWPVSVSDPVVELSPGTSLDAVLPALHCLAPLRTVMRDLVLESALPDPSKLTREAADAKLLARAAPIDYAYVDLRQGVHVVWPGMANLPNGYDVRHASFYQLSAYRHGTRWGAPYVDATTDPLGDDLVLPCTRGVWTPDGDYLGIAGVEITVTKMVDTSMAMKTRTTIRTSLVNGAGQKVIDSRDANRRFVARNDEAIVLPEFDLEAVATEIRAGREGIVETSRDGRPIVAAIVRLDAIGWYYVVEVEASSLGDQPGGGSRRNSSAS